MVDNNEINGRDQWNLVDLFLWINNRLPNEKDWKPCDDKVNPNNLCKEYIKVYDLDEALLRDNESWNHEKRLNLYRFAKAYLWEDKVVPTNKNIPIPKKQITGFCTLFKKKNNRPLKTYDTVWEAKEINYKFLIILNSGILPVSENAVDNIQDYLDNNEKKPVKLSEEAEELIVKFDKKYRLLISKK